jgi:hypothetical protein
MILRSSNDKLFKIDKKSILISKQILYVRENYLKFQEELGGIRVYREDPDYFINKDFDIINNSIKSNYDFLRLMGINFSNSKNYIKPIKF